jgi:arginine utilization protein RocB
MDAEIVSLLAELVALKSVSGTAGEKQIEDFLLAHLRALPYFTARPELCGAVTLPGDALGRRVIFALVQGKRPATVLFMNHHDVVDTSVYGAAEPWACDLKRAARHVAELKISDEARQDLESGAWLFGRGACDMKGGLAVQLTVLKAYAQDPEQGSLLFVSVPDEEAFSAGMRGALPFLQQLRAKYHLDYKILINCEPNRREGDQQVVSCGSVGKLLPVVLVQGKVVQIGSYAQGLNPVSVLAELVTRTEGDKEFVEHSGAEQTVPPVWYFMRDLKRGYDYSLPAQAAGYCNILCFKRSASQVLAYFVRQTEAAVQSALAKQLRLVQTGADKDVARAASDVGRHETGESNLQPAITNLVHSLPVLTFAALQKQAQQKTGYDHFAAQLQKDLAAKLAGQELDYPQATIAAMQATLTFCSLTAPVAVVGFAPPYYPALNSHELAGREYAALQELIGSLLPVRFEDYFLGVSDCSYCGLTTQEDSAAYAENTPLWGPLYSFNLQALGELQIPFFLLGPWGKDLHQVTERVNIHSLTVILPALLQKVLQRAWA